MSDVASSRPLDTRLQLDLNLRTRLRNVMHTHPYSRVVTCAVVNDERISLLVDDPGDRD